jgi:LysR family transcriptional regulator, transcriptional activator of the cysJI operon
MDFEILQLFLDICDQSSFSKVAALHAVSQSAISQRMAQLERYLGHKLFDRKARPLRLTPAGEIVYESVRRMMAVHSNMQSHLEDLQPSLSGPVRLGCIFSLAIGPLRQVLRQFLHEAPRVELHVSHGETYELAQDVLNGLLDLAIVAYGEKVEGIQIENAGSEPMLLVASPDMRNLPTGTVPISWLEKQPFITFPQHSPTRQAIDAVFKQLHLAPPMSLEVANPVVLIEAVAAGRGIALLPFSSIVTELERGELLRLSCPEVEFARPICILLHRRRPRTRATRALADFLTANLPRLQATWHAAAHQQPGINSSLYHGQVKETPQIKPPSPGIPKMLPAGDLTNE